MKNFILYLLGFIRGKKAGKGMIVISGGITCADDGNGNITITEEADNNG